MASELHLRRLILASPGQETSGYMRISRQSSLLLAVFVLAATVAACANTQVTMSLVGVGGANQNGVYVAPYLFRVNGGPIVGMMCDDFTHEDHIPETYTAVVSTIGDLSQTRFFSTFGVQGYEEVFWLYDQYLQHPSQAGNINFAVWALFYPSLYTNPTLAAKYWTPAEAAWLHAAQTADLSHYDFSYFRVYTPISPTSPQEMIYKTPEPASMILFGSGLMTIAGLVRRRQKS